MTYLANQMGNIDDIKCSLKHFNYSLEDLEKALENEKGKEQPRQTVIKLIESNIKRIQKTAL